MDFIAKVKKLLMYINKYRFVIVIVLAGVVLMLIPTGNEEVVTLKKEEIDTEELTLEKQLSLLLSEMDGAGKVQVMLSVATGTNTVYDKDISGSDRQETVIVTDADRTQNGLIQRVDPPVYLGAIVLCQGADSPGVCLMIVQAVSSITGLGADRISVLKMK